MANTRLIVITGPAAVGKSTLARALQAALTRDGDLWLLIELDVFGRAMPRQWIAWDGRRGRNAGLGLSYDKLPDGRVELTLGPDGRRLMSAFHCSVAAVVRSGVNVVCEAIVHDDADWSDWSDALAGLEVTWVRLSAPLATLESREAAEPARVFQGLARGMAERPIAGVYDIEADTGAETPEAIVARIVGMRDQQ